MSEVKKLTPDQIALLKKPLPQESIKPHPTKAYLSSIKAIYVVERLNDVFGLGGWFANNEVVKEEGKWVVVKSTFQAPEYGIVIPDIFGGNDNADLGDAYKGACTDALTKIGSYLYIGMDVYKGLADNKINGTTLYNHKALDNPIPNEEFKTLAEKAKKGDLKALTTAKAKYNFTKEQQDLLNLLYKNSKQPA